MKNLFLAFLSALTISACSSGSTVTESPANVTSRFQGTFQNTPNTQSGSVIIDIIEDASGGISGNIIFQASGNNCLRNAPISGNSSGFNMNLTAPQAAELFTTEITLTEADTEETDPETGAVTVTPGEVISVRTVTSNSGVVGSSTTTLSNGDIESRQTIQSDITGDLNITFAIGNNGSSLGGTYVVTGQTCNNSDGSGSMNLSI
jgi:hypothetical protein